MKSKVDGLVWRGKYRKLAPKDSNLDKQIQSLVPDDHAATGNDQT